MLLGIYTVYDRVAAEAGPPYMAKNDGIALRNMNIYLMKIENKEDYELRKLCDFDTETCVLSDVGVNIVEVNFNMAKEIQDGKGI